MGGGGEKGKKMGRKKGTIEILKEDKQIEKHNDMNKDVQLKGLINFALNCVEQVWITSKYSNINI